MFYVNQFLTKILSSAKAKFHKKHLAINAAAAPPDPKSHIVWVDMEMTGLNIKKDKVLEISVLITDKHLNIVAEGPDLVIHQPDEVLNSMNEWCIKHHGETGLTEQSRQSIVTEQLAEDEIMEFLKLHVPKRICPLAGNSVYMDRLFINEFFPKVHEYLHYRIIDVSSIKELCKRWYPGIYHAAPQKKIKHRSLDDIKESIAELAYYKKSLFKNGNI